MFTSCPAAPYSTETGVGSATTREWRARSHFSSTAHPSSLAAARGHHTCSPGPCALPVHRRCHTRAHPRRARGLLDGAAHHRRTPQRRHRGDVLALPLGPRSSARVGSRNGARPPPRAVHQSLWMAVASAWARGGALKRVSARNVINATETAPLSRGATLRPRCSLRCRDGPRSGHWSLVGHCD